ncbi:MAG: TfoX/Sxy family protein [Gammaproteobacteria bacterium]|nr:TfoX/Sxy family protein [Gammaproteobacteria bacterium]
MSEFVQSLHEVFERLGRIETRRMFGGHGVYHEGRMIGLVSGDRLYLKTDAESAAHFDERRLPPFEYQRAGKLTPTSYREAPAEVFEERDEAALWGRRAWEAALRSGHAPKARKDAKARTTLAKPKGARPAPSTSTASSAAPRPATRPRAHKP